MLSHWSYPVEEQRIEGLPPMSLALGTFDGVHRGHVGVLQASVALSHRFPGSLPVALTFEPPPWSILQSGRDPHFLTPLPEKVHRLLDHGVNRVYAFRFDRFLASLEPKDFIRDVLLRFPLTGVAVGFNFSFGRKRSGGVGDLVKGLAGKVPVTIVPPVCQQGYVTSSTRLRCLLSQGRVAAARRLLGRFYVLEGLVVRGEQRGRLLGFPTANLEMELPFQWPAHGVYAVLVGYRGGRWPGVLHCGPQPTFSGSQRRLEVHIVGFSGNLYGERLRVEFVGFLRPIHTFPSSSDLMQQIEEDIRCTRSILGRFPGLHLPTEYRTMAAACDDRRAGHRKNQR
ncbi:riboflavin biosynthesis protein RibF [Pasteuria penetrans]|uniref:riboflavin biosynthesis protein RibF n=1 Tax=Pasteuria penetrans TaxID=86005 RepID=UPI000F96F078|nr:riboflavin biosynthesis protein RibF [Pasteuria penetrans]